MKKVGARLDYWERLIHNLMCLYKPSTALNALAIVIVSATFLCLVANIVAKGTHYRQLVDFLQFIAATIYL
jgi:hypothetical protein